MISEQQIGVEPGPFDPQAVTPADFLRWTEEMHERDAARPAIEPLVVLFGGRTLIEDRDFTVDYGSGLIRFHEDIEGGLVTVGLARNLCPRTPAVVPFARPAGRSGVAQWKREQRGRRS